jgi:predicted small lipoprotein YifL
MNSELSLRSGLILSRPRADASVHTNLKKTCQLKTQNSKLKTPVLTVFVLTTTLLACGKKGPPLPPVVRVAERTNNLTAYQEGDEAVLTWPYPSLTTAGGALPDVEGVEVWRAALPKGQEPPPPVSPQDHAERRQLLGSQGEVVALLDPAALADATRGEKLVYRDDLARWRSQSTVDVETLVLWYAVQTICCGGRESELSNVVRLLPQAPPEPPQGLELQAGAGGIEITWKPAPGLTTLVERSPDGATWKRVTPEAVAGDEWRDTEAAQGRSWSYRLRSVQKVEGGGEVVGPPSEPMRVDHPDTYPPAAPQGVICLPEGSRVRVRWQAVPGAATYRVSRTVDGKDRTALAIDQRQIEFVDASPPLGELTYEVIAVDKAGNTSELSACEVVMGAMP